jgi:DNA-binding transcriptional ArsR family regulator
MTAPAVSQHLKTLRAAGLVSVRAQAQRRIYQLDPRGIDELSQWITNIRRFWATKLDALDHQLLEEEKR